LKKALGARVHLLRVLLNRFLKLNSTTGIVDSESKLDQCNVPSQLPWYPFGKGNHVCPGQHLAHAEMKVIISRILNKFSIETLFPKEQTQQKGFFTLRATTARIKLVENR
jgi:cytochrome P450